MWNFFSFVLIAAYCASNVVADSRQCPGGYDDGAQMEMGKYWYECRDAQMVPKGCLSEDGRRVEIDSTFDTKEFRMQCVLGSDGFLTLNYKACVHSGNGRDIGSQWDDGSAFYTCVREGNNVRVTMLGCVDQGKPLRFDDRVAKGDFMYDCKKSASGTPTLNKAGCVFEGRKYNIGETIEGSKYWYTCTDSGAQVVGCMHAGQKLRDGDHITDTDMMVTCKVTSSGASMEPFACLARDDNGVAIERQVGCFWTEGNNEYTCTVSGGKVAKTLVRSIN